MKDGIKSVLWGIGGIVCFIVMIYVSVLLFSLGIGFLFILAPILLSIGGILFFLNLLLFIPLSFFRKTYIVSGFAFFISSYLFGLLLFLYSFSVAYILWGWFGIIVGLFLGGIGVVPIALLASLLNGQWWFLFNILFSAFLVYGFRLWGAHLLSKHDEKIVAETKVINA